MNPFIALRGRFSPRKRLSDLCELDDHLLADIGLTRNDLLWAGIGKAPKPARVRR